MLRDAFWNTKRSAASEDVLAAFGLFEPRSMFSSGLPGGWVAAGAILGGWAALCVVTRSRSLRDNLRELAGRAHLGPARSASARATGGALAPERERAQAWLSSQRIAAE